MASSPLLSPSDDHLADEEKVPPSSRDRSFAISLVRQILTFKWLRLRQLQLVLPSFLQRRQGSEHRQQQASTAWLDGMRGWASFFVFIRHFASATHPDIQVGYAADEDNLSLIQLPFLRLLVSGPAMVSLFFIISGYALSWGPLNALHSHQGSVEQCLTRLSSATFRRATRLFLPGIVSTFIVAVCISIGLYDRGHDAINVNDMPGFWEPEPPQFREDAGYVQFQDWMQETWRFLNVWTPAGHSYDAHLWTLPVEFRCSIILFISLAGLARCGAHIRAAILFSMVLYCHGTDFWEGWLFFAGSFLAQIKLIQEERRKPAIIAQPTQLDFELELELERTPRLPRSRKHRRYDSIRITLFILGLFLLSAPDYGYADSAPFYMTISSSLTPSSWPENWRFLHCLGSAFVMYSTSSTTTPSLRWLFSNPLSRYLGQISYALYLVHGPIVHMLGFWLVPWFWDNVTWQSRDGMWGKELGFAYAFVIVTVLVVWAADLFWRGVDVKCVQFAKWMEAMMVELR